MEHLTNRYVYQPLSKPCGIRIIDIHPALRKDDKKVRFSIEHVNLNDQTLSFEAISYAWGDASDTEPVYCQDQSINVPTNLCAAMRSLRLADKPRRLWADAVCINQQDILERSSQVAMMQTIFSRAERVLVWLGEKTSELEGLTATIETGLNLVPDDESIAEWGDELASRWTAHFRELLRRDENNFYTHDWTPFFHLLRRPWFQRKWVIQEVSSSRDAIAIWGTESRPFRQLGTLATYLAFPGMEAALTDRAERVDPMLLQALANCSLISALTEPWATGADTFGGYIPFVKATRTFFCSDPRDHVYSMLGLFPQGSEDQVLPDYNKTSREVFTEFTTRQLRAGRWDVLGLSCTNKRDRALPSWVPDLSCPDQRNLLSAFPLTEKLEIHPFAAGGPASEPFTVVDDRILQCQGIIIDSIVDLETQGLTDPPSMPSPVSSPPQLSPLLLETRRKHLAIPETCHWLKRCCSMAAGSHQALSPSRFTQFWQTMTCELHRGHVRMGPEMASVFADYMTYVDECHRVSSAEWHRDMVVRVLPVESSLKTFATNGMNFATTEEGRLGQMPRVARVGDRICVVLGSRVPFVVRPTGRGTYFLVGECYVNGMMDGEALSLYSTKAETISME